MVVTTTIIVSIEVALDSLIAFELAISELFQRTLTSTIARQWILTGQEGFESSLEYQTDAKIPTAQELGPHDVLVKIEAASLNYRELVIAGPMGINGPISPPVVPGCDGAGVVEAIGSSVDQFYPGDRVLTHVAPKVVEARGDDSPANIMDAMSCLGQEIDGTLRTHGVFYEGGLVHAPKSLTSMTAATLPCTWTTAWNCLFGVKGREIGPDDWVFVQGTGGVSVAVLQVAVAVGATVIATTSSDEKASRLKALGAAHVINYRKSPQDWGKIAKSLTPQGRGIDFVIDIGGNETLAQSLAAVRVDGIVLVVGGVGETTETVPLFSVLLNTCIVRGVLASSRAQFRDLVRFIDDKGITPAVDDVVFELSDVKEAYRRLKEKRHFSKVIISVKHE